MIDPAMLDRIVSAVPPSAWGQAVLLLSLLFGLAKWIAPIRQQAVPAKGSQNGHSDTLHRKLDRIDERLVNMDGRFERIEGGLERVVERVGDLEEKQPQLVVQLASKLAAARVSLGMADPLAPLVEEQQRKREG